MDVMSSGNDSYSEPMFTVMSEYICDSSQSHPSVNMREAQHTICDCIKQSQAEWKGALLSMWNMGKRLHKVFKAVVNDILQVLPSLGEYGS